MSTIVEPIQEDEYEEIYETRFFAQLHQFDFDNEEYEQINSIQRRNPITPSVCVIGDRVVSNSYSYPLKFDPLLSTLPAREEEVFSC